MSVNTSQEFLKTAKIWLRSFQFIVLAPSFKSAPINIHIPTSEASNVEQIGIFGAIKITVKTRKSAITRAYAENRKNTVFVNVLIDETEGVANFYEVKNDAGWENQVSSMHKETLAMGKGFEADVKQLNTKPVSAIKEINRPIDLCLIDVEGHEFSVLKSFDWVNQAPNILVVENNGQFYSRKSLVNYLVQKGYVHVARIGTTDDIFCHTTLNRIV